MKENIFFPRQNLLFGSTVSGFSKGQKSTSRTPERCAISRLNVSYFKKVEKNNQIIFL